MGLTQQNSRLEFHWNFVHEKHMRKTTLTTSRGSKLAAAAQGEFLELMWGVLWKCHLHAQLQTKNPMGG